MSEKTIKKLRRLQKMESQQPQQPRFMINQLENYIALHVHLTGKKPETIEVTPDFYMWYTQESARHIETMGGKVDFPDGMKFLGVKIEKKVVIEKP